MTELYIPVSHGRWPEDGNILSDLVFESEEEASNHGEEMTEGDFGHNQFFLKEVEVVKSD